VDSGAQVLTVHGTAAVGAVGIEHDDVAGDEHVQQAADAPYGGTGMDEHDLEALMAVGPARAEAAHHVDCDPGMQDAAVQHEAYGIEVLFCERKKLGVHCDHPPTGVDSGDTNELPDTTADPYALFRYFVRSSFFPPAHIGHPFPSECRPRSQFWSQELQGSSATKYTRAELGVGR